MTKSVSVGPLAVLEQTLPPYQNNHMRDACLLPIPASSKLELFIYLFFNIYIAIHKGKNANPNVSAQVLAAFSPPRPHGP